MGTVWKRFTDYTHQSLAWLFVWMSALYHVGFALPYEQMHASVLYTTLNAVHGGLPEVWAGVGVLATILLLVSIAIGSRIGVKVSSVILASVWIFALVIYLINGVALLALAIAATQVMFWAWNLAMREHEKNKN